MDTRSWPRRKLIRFSITTCIILLLLAEIIFRIAAYFEYREYNTSVYIQGSTIQMSDSLLVFRNRPYYLDYYRRFQYNEQGMKAIPGDVFMPVKRENDFWVFLFGASAMEGMGSNNDGEWLDITGTQDYPWANTIAARLQQQLQQQLPAKNVRVFTAANSSFSIQQSMLLYRRLSARYKMDWVVSLDGQNEPFELETGITVMDEVRKGWEKNPVNQYPLKLVTSITSHSALVNKIKQALFNFRLNGRLEKNKEDQYPRRQYWLEQPTGQVYFAPKTVTMSNALAAFHSGLKSFDSLLTQNNQPHLLLIQPHLAFRDTSVLKDTEKALYNYYCSAYNDPLHNTFFREVYSGFPAKFTDSNSTVQLLTALNTYDKPVFVDYCHFTEEINNWLAKHIADYILSSGNKAAANN